MEETMAAILAGPKKARKAPIGMAAKAVAD
jgi:hypothetical protein